MERETSEENLAQYSEVETALAQQNLGVVNLAQQKNSLVKTQTGMKALPHGAETSSQCCRQSYPCL